MRKRQRKTTSKRFLKRSQQNTALANTSTHETQAPELDVRSPQLLTTPQGITQLQRTIGNAAVQRLLVQKAGSSVAQRSPLDEKSDRPWQPPDAFDPGGTAVTRRDGMWGVLVMNDKMEDVKRALDADVDSDLTTQLDSAVKAGRMVFKDLADKNDPEGDLTAGEVGQLEFLGLLVENTYKEGLSRVRSRAQRNIAPLLKEPDTEKLDAAKKDLAEKLHQAFIKGKTGTTISNMGEAFKQIEEYKKKADNVVKWAKKISDQIEWAKASELLEIVGKKSKALGEGMDKVKQVISTAESLETLFGDSRTSGVHDGINRMRAGLDLIDTTMTFAKAVPLLGTLWSNYYAPLTRAILNQLEILADYKDYEGRQWAQYEWMVKQMRGQRKAGEPPTIPQGLDEFFPGGQPVFDFMYRLMNDGSPQVTGTVEKFFAARGDLFNAPIKSGKKLETDSSTWYNPFDNDDEAPNLASWVRGNKDMVWAQLYGSMPSDL